MKTWLNDPKINRKYNYLYEIKNKINDRIYIGVHRTDNLEDSYMGSGKIIKRAINKYGVINFEKTILEFFPTYQEALDKEKQLVNLNFIENANTYNIKEGGYGNCAWSTTMLKKLSESAKKRWQDPNYRKTMIKSFNTKERKKKCGQGIKEWIQNNPEQHYEKMLKINKNPDKIKKTMEKHIGTKRSQKACNNISKGLSNYLKNNPEKAKKITGKGCHYIYNVKTHETRRLKINETIPEGWVKGNGRFKKT